MATYDLGTSLGKVRLLVADTDTADPIWEDDEIEAFIALASDLYGAAAMAIRSLAGDRVRRSKKIQREGYTSDQFGIDEILKLADALDAQSLQSGGLVAVDIMDHGNQDDYFEAWRPGFVDSGDEVVGS